MQGQTIPNVGLYLPQHVLSHGKLYVALSRGISMSRTKVIVLTKKLKCHNEIYTKNIVYKDVSCTNGGFNNITLLHNSSLEDTNTPMQT